MFLCGCAKVQRRPERGRRKGAAAARKRGRKTRVPGLGEGGFKDGKGEGRGTWWWFGTGEGHAMCVLFPGRRQTGTSLAWAGRGFGLGREVGWPLVGCAVWEWVGL